MPASRRALVVALACLSNFSLSCFAAAQLIVPSAGSVGPCEVFIIVSAGQSTAQFQMESVAAMVSGPAPKKGHPITPSTPRGRQFGAQPVVSQSVPDMLFAVPQGDPGNEPAVDSNASACPKSVADDPVTIGEARRRPVQRARTLCLLHLQDRSRPKPNPKLRRRWCQRRATLLALLRAPMLRAKCGSNLKHLVFRGQRSWKVLAGDGPLF
jgi:hypothetical protein